MAATGWKRPFSDPIPLPRGRQIVTVVGSRVNPAAAASSLSEYAASRFAPYKVEGKVIGGTKAYDDQKTSHIKAEDFDPRAASHH